MRIFIYIYIRIRIYTFISIYIYIYMYIIKYKYINTYEHQCIIWICVYILIYVYICKYILNYMYLFFCSCIHKLLWVYIYTIMSIYVYTHLIHIIYMINMHVHIWVCLYLYIYIYIYRYRYRYRYRYIDIDIDIDSMPNHTLIGSKRHHKPPDGSAARSLYIGIYPQKHSVGCARSPPGRFNFPPFWGSTNTPKTAHANNCENQGLWDLYIFECRLEIWRSVTSKLSSSIFCLQVKNFSFWNSHYCQLCELFSE